MPFCIVPLRSLEVAARLQIPQHTRAAYLDRTDAKFFFCITRAASPGTPTGTPACSSTTAKIPLPAPPPVAPSPSSFGMVSPRADSTSSSSRESRCCGPAASTFRPASWKAESPTCSSVAAPFLLHRDTFSCRNAPDIHNAFTSISSNDSLLPHAGGKRKPKFRRFRLNFAVANL